MGGHLTRDLLCSKHYLLVILILFWLLGGIQKPLNSLILELFPPLADPLLAENNIIIWSLEMDEKQNSGHMLDIWFFAGMVLVCYGIILIGVGIYYLFNPYRSTVLAELHPNLWWGGIMFLSGLVLYWLSWKGRSSM